MVEFLQSLGSWVSVLVKILKIRELSLKTWNADVVNYVSGFQVSGSKIDLVHASMQIYIPCIQGNQYRYTESQTTFRYETVYVVGHDIRVITMMQRHKCHCTTWYTPLVTTVNDAIVPHRLTMICMNLPRCYCFM